MYLTRYGIRLGIILLSIVALPYALVAQTRIPDIELREVNGKTFDPGSLARNNKPLIVIFWATWCKPCIEEMDNITEVYEEWQDEIDFEVIAVCIDDTRSSPVIRSFVAGKDWPFRIIVDTNQNLKDASGITGK